MCLGARHSASEWGGSGGVGRAGAQQLRLQLAALRLTASLSNLAGTAVLVRNPPKARPQVPPPLCWLRPAHAWPLPRISLSSASSASFSCFPAGLLAAPPCLFSDPSFPGFCLPTLRLRLSFLPLRPSFPLLRLSELVFLGPGLASLPLLLRPTVGRVVAWSALGASPSAAGPCPVRLDPVGPTRLAFPSQPPAALGRASILPSPRASSRRASSRLASSGGQWRGSSGRRVRAASAARRIAAVQSSPCR